MTRTGIPLHLHYPLMFVMETHSAFCEVESDLRARSLYCENGVLATLCLPVYSSICPSTSNNTAPTWRIFIEFDIGAFFENPY